MFAQSSNNLVLNPIKKSIKYAFGIDVGIEWAEIKAYIEKHYATQRSLLLSRFSFHLQRLHL